MIGTKQNLKDGLIYFYPKWRVVESQRARRLDIYVDGDITSSRIAELDLIRPLGCEFRFHKMTFLQKFFFQPYSWSINK